MGCSPWGCKESDRAECLTRSEEHTSELQSQADVRMVISLIREGKKTGVVVKQAQWSLRTWDT